MYVASKAQLAERPLSDQEVPGSVPGDGVMPDRIKWYYFLPCLILRIGMVELG